LLLLVVSTAQTRVYFTSLQSDEFLPVSLHDENRSSERSHHLKRETTVNAVDLPLNVDVAVRYGDKDDLELVGLGRKGQQQRENIVDALHVMSMKLRGAGFSLPCPTYRIGVNDDAAACHDLDRGWDRSIIK